MRYWIDGYNLLFSFPHFSGGSFTQRREELILQLREQALCLGLDLVVVFDSPLRKYDLDECSRLEGLEIIYAASKSTADELILEAIECNRIPTEICVVTEDKDLARKARALQAKTLAFASFFAKLSRRQRKKKQDLSIECEDSPQEISRLLRIFEKKLKEGN